MNISENQNVINDIVPFLHNALGWNKDNIYYEVKCSSGYMDILYKYRNKNIALVEAKRPNSGKGHSIEQAIKYARSSNTPIAIATDYRSYWHTHHTKKNCPLLNYEGKEIGWHDRSLLYHGNLLYLARHATLQKKIKSDTALNKIFKALNDKGKDAGLTSGIERVSEIGKIIFIKMLVDNNVQLENADWEDINNASVDRKIQKINSIIEYIRSEGIQIKDIIIDTSKSNTVNEIIHILNEINMHNTYYDMNSTLFQKFLSERARGGGTSDLGQYFTPKNVIELLYYLSNYTDGNTIYDPYCGTGGVLNEFFIRHATTPRTKKDFGKKYLYGSEITNELSNLAQMNMVLVGDGHSNISNIDSLLKTNPFVEHDRKFDRVITNIPFDPTTPSEDIPEDYFKLSNNTTDLSNFVEHCINRCKVNGRIVLIVGKGFLTEKKSSEFRRKLLTTYDLEAVYMLYGGVFLPYTPVYSCVLVINKNKPTDYIDFYSINNKDDISTVNNYHSDPSRYDRGFYKIPQQKIIENLDCDFRGKLYLQNSKENGECTLRDIVDVPKKEVISNGAHTHILRKLTTPNCIEDGIYLIDTQSTKQVGDGVGSFNIKLHKDAIVISRIPNKRVADGRYIGSAYVGDDYGNLVTGEYHQIIPKNKEHTYFILHYIRNKRFQEIVELASGTGGQQRIELDIILDEPIPIPNEQNISRANAEINRLQKLLDEKTASMIKSLILKTK